MNTCQEKKIYEEEASNNLKYFTVNKVPNYSLMKF